MKNPEDKNKEVQVFMCQSNVLYPLFPCFPLQDFALLPEKDKTYLIDGGGTLSGGQRARLCLAR